MQEEDSRQVTHLRDLPEAEGNGFPRQEPVAIIGMACRFPGSNGLADFWRQLMAGENAVVQGPPGSVIGRAGQFPPNSNVYSEALRYGAHLKDIDQFDAEFFRISPIEAQLLDPQQRMMLETSWLALEDAGIDPESLRNSRTGIYAGISIYDYREATIDAAETDEIAAGLYAVTGTALNTAIGRVSYALGLEGPALAIDTACSSSLVAIQQAIGALERREADLVIAGGVNVHLSGRHLDLRANAGMLSPTGQCKTFDAAADGFVCGEGCGLVILKRLSQAESDGDRIWAVIRGTSVNQDGASQGLTVPSATAQKKAMEEALSRAGADPSEIDYLEAHGTGTVVGDPIEVAAAAEVYQKGRESGRPVLIGSVKTNIGHLGPAAGIAGLIKTVLAMRNGVIPRHLNFKDPNPRIDWDNLPVQVTDVASDWPSHSGNARLAAVNAFGWSGTNAHVVVEGYGRPDKESVKGAMSSPKGSEVYVSGISAPDGEYEERETRLLPLSGKTPGALRDLATEYLQLLHEKEEELSRDIKASGKALADMAWTAATGRSHFPYRAGMTFNDASDLGEKLQDLSQRFEGQDYSPAHEGAKVAFVFTGQGSQWPGMGRDLYVREPVFRSVLDRCDQLILEERGVSLLDVMFGRPGTEGLIDQPAWTQPAIYTLECALVALWESVGVKPDVVLGHSLGEIAASTSAGGLTLEEGLRYAAARGELLGATRSDGAMAAVFAPRTLIESLVTERNATSADVGLSLAVDNGPQHVLSGPTEDLEAVLEVLENQGVNVVRLRRSPAYHSALVEPALDELEAAIRNIVPDPPLLSLPLISNITGMLLDRDDRMDAAYWRRHARSPVFFRSCVETLADLGVGVVVEIGPHSVLGPVVSMSWPRSASDETPAILASLRRPPRDATGPSADTSGGFVEAVAGAYEARLNINFAGLFSGEHRCRVSLPGYPFQHSSHWVQTPKRRRVSSDHPLLGTRHESPRGEVMFETEMFPSDPVWLLDHLVFGRVVAPGGMYGAMAVSAFFSDRSGLAAVHDMQTYSPLIFQPDAREGGGPDNGRRVQFVLDGPVDSTSRRFEIYSKAESEDGWTLHAEGNLATGPRVVEFPDPVDLDELRAGLEPVDTAEFYRNRYSDDISLGPAYRTIRAVWSKGGRALGELALRESVDASGTELHPLLLDGCFQVLSVARYLSGVEQGAVYMPFGWDRLWVAGPMPERIVCHAVLRNPPSGGAAGAPTSAPPEVVTGDVTFYSLDGVPIGGLEGFTVKRATRTALLAADGNIKDLLYETVWQEKPLARTMDSAEFLSRPSDVAARSRPLAGYLADEGVNLRDRVGFLTDIERLSQAYVLSAFEKLGWVRVAGQIISPEELRNSLKITDEHRRLFGRLLSLLSVAGILTPGDAGFVVALGVDDPLPDQSLCDPEFIATELLGKYPHGIYELNLLRRCGAALAEVLQGRTDPLSLLFSDEGAGAADLYLGAPASIAANRMLGDSVGTAVSNLPVGRKLRVLEIGAGTGSATAAALRSLPSGRFDYTYTDISAGFFSQGEERFSAQGTSIEYRPLNIELDPAAQGFDSHGYDLVIAANVLHATRDLGETLAHCRELLAPSGVMIALEIMQRRSFQDLTFGLLEGWWRFDDRYRTDSALLTEHVWRRAIADADFHEVEFLDASDPGSEEQLGSNVIIARGPAEIANSAGLWVIAADDGGVAEELTSELTARNQTVILASDKSVAGSLFNGTEGVSGAFVDPEHRESWKELLQQIPGEPPLKGVVHLTSLDGRGTSASTEEMAEDVRRGSASALALVQGLLDSDMAPSEGIWFVTRGAQVLERDPVHDTSAQPGAAALWGFGRVVALEGGHLKPRLIDLNPATGEAEIGTLAHEILHHDDESYVAHRNGSRYAARLVRMDSENRELSLREGAETGGRLRNDRTYLVTGGLGGIGCAVARWLAEKGAGVIVLNGRRDPDPHAETLINELRENGADVRVELADVTDATAVDGMLERIGKTMPPLGGVIHSVGVLSDGAIGNQTWDRFQQVLWPKVLGAWHLHRATLKLDLDLFVLFSSITGVLGNPGQSNHAAANAFLDQLASHRRSLGLAGQAIAWGAWSDIGEAAEQRERIERQLVYAGTGWLTPQQGIRALDWLVSQDVASATVIPADWLIVSEGTEGQRMFLEPLLPSESQAISEPEEHTTSSDLLTQLRRTPGEQQQGLLTSFVRQELQSVLRMASPPSATVSFFDLGMDSLMAVELRNRINRALAGEYAASNTIVFDFPTAATMAEFLARELGPLSGLTPVAREMPASRPHRVRQEDEPIAIVGMACRFPGAPGIDAFWRLLEEGRNAVTDGRSDTGSWEDVLGDPKAKDPIFRLGAFVEGIDQFDSAFFQIAPIEARLMDPQHRMLLETVWQVLEDAGVDPEQLRGSRTGVFAGIGSSGYRDLAASRGHGYTYSGTGEAIAVGRVAFALGLEGPAMPLDLACASSLAAIHQAVVSLQRGEVDMALAGGVNATLSTVVSEFLAGMGMLSQSGRCNAFDASADGYVRGEGCGMVALKRLGDAEVDGDRIWGLVLGTAINQNGMSAKLMAPNGPAQERVMEDALARAGVLPSDVDYLEAQGVGSEFGDPIEMNAIANTYGLNRSPGRPLLVGSVKTNIGHSEWASGIAGLIKAVLAMRRGVVPRNLHFNDPSPLLDWDRLPVSIPSQSVKWPSCDDRPPLAAVNAYGLSGTNAHVVLSGYPEPDTVSGNEWPSGAAQLVPVTGPVPDPFTVQGNYRERSARLLPLSGKSSEALRTLAQRYCSYLDELLEAQPIDPNPALSRLADMAWTAGVGRSHFDFRAGVAFGDASQLRERLQEVAVTAKDDYSGQINPHSAEPPGVAFMYAGQYGPWLHAGQYLYETEPVIRNVLDRCNETLIKEKGAVLLDVVFGGDDVGGKSGDSSLRAAAVFAIECALTDLWKSMGVNPSVIVGHGFGKAAAAYASSAVNLEDGLRLAVAFHEALLKQGVSSTETTPVFQPDALAGLHTSPLLVATVDGTDGHLLQAGGVLEGSYWNANILMSHARSAKAVSEMGVGVLIEMGPYSDLGEGILNTLREFDRVQNPQRKPALISSLEATAGNMASETSFLEAVSKAYGAGLNIGFSALFAGESRCRVPLPGYPFQRRRYWVDALRSDKST